MSQKTFYTATLLFFVGISISSHVSIPFMVALSFLVVVLCCLWFIPKKIIGIGLIALTLGILRMELSKYGKHPLDVMVGTPTEIRGIICEEPSRKELVQKFCFKPIENKDRVLVTVPRYPEYEYGDYVSLRGTLQYPKNFLAYEHGPEFDYVSYLAKDDVRYLMVRPQIEVIYHDRGSILLSFLFSIKSSFTKTMQHLLVEPDSSLLGGLLLGEKQSLPSDITDAFKKSGLVHILVLSGSNVTVVAESFMKLFSFLPRHLGQSFGAVSIVLFALMTGASATTVRATCMALIAILVRTSRRPYTVDRALVLAACLMVLHNPRLLVFDVSFQLSVLATLALLYVGPIVSRYLAFIPEMAGLREICSTTLASLIFVTPFTLYTMGQLSLIALIANILVLPCVSYAMLGGFIAVMVGFIHQTLALPIAWLTSLILSYMIQAVLFFGTLSFASVNIRINAITVVGIYILYGYGIYRLRNQTGE